jgi:hypothetical protein
LRDAVLDEVLDVVAPALEDVTENVLVVGDGVG